LKVCKCDVDQAKELSEQFRIMSIPALLFFKQGELVGQHIGTLTKGALTAMINEVL
ncbi:MAG: thioredoxin family protein, partial [Eubacteriaceae bacterium]|nr:thioredoxin family protein [Eubacteriaceae bacterium]